MTGTGGTTTTGTTSGGTTSTGTTSGGTTSNGTTSGGTTSNGTTSNGTTSNGIVRTAVAERFQMPVLTGIDLQRNALPDFTIEPAQSAREEADYFRIRREVFVAEQALFAADDRDDVDDDPRHLSLLARDRTGAVLGGVRLAPVGESDIGWWTGSRLVVTPAARNLGGVGAALVRAACEHARSRGVLRFDATVQARNEVLFRRWGWQPAEVGETGTTMIGGLPHVRLRYPIDRIQRLVDATKSALAGVLAPLRDQPDGLGCSGFVGDDGSPVPGSDLIAACDAILPSMVERNPEWAGWCAVLVNINDLTAMGADPVALLDAIGARDASFARRIVTGLRNAAAAWGVPVIGGHTQLGVPAALSVTALGRTDQPIPAGGGRPGHTLTVTADLTGGWRSGYTGAQWDSTSGRSQTELRQLAGLVGRMKPAAAKDVSMAGLAGTVGMLAEASNCSAVLDVAAVPRPAGTTVGDWLSCFPGYAMVTAAAPGSSPPPKGPAVTSECGELHTKDNAAPAVGLRWPDGVITPAVAGAVTGLGAA